MWDGGTDPDPGRGRDLRQKTAIPGSGELRWWRHGLLLLVGRRGDLEVGHEVAGSRSSSCSRKEAREDDAEQPFLEAGDGCSVEAEKIEAGSWLRGTVVDRWG